jgi:ATP-dependent exoDNAse (exonuclease V) beta subunit
LHKLLPFLPLFDRPDDSGQPEARPQTGPAPSPAGPPDAEARRQALDTRRSFIVQAPAGSGKTGLLIQRLLKLLADPSVEQPEQVLAITFTVKATNELRDRVLAHLTRAANSPAVSGVLTELAAASEPGQALDSFQAETRSLALDVVARDRQLGWSLLDHPHRLNIRTIDSVCAQIARTLPVLSGSGGRLVPTGDADFLHREAARRTLLLLGSGDSAFDAALRNLILNRDGNLAGCEALVANMLSVRDQWGDLVPVLHPRIDDAWLDANVRPRLQLALEEAICRRLTQLAQAFPPQILADLSDLAGHLGHNEGYGGAPSPIAHCAGVHDPPEPVSAHLERWRALIHLLLTAEGWRKERGINGRHLGFEYDRKHRHHSRLVAILDQLAGRDDMLSLFEEVRALPPAEYPDDQWAIAKALFRVLSRALAELQLVFAARNQCDFTEVTLLARYALAQDSGPEDLATALGARLQHLLVDEMQDTSTSQYELLERLTASWDGHSQTVFLVGDPRQSIYLFRQARVERFIRALSAESLGDLSLTRLNLAANFRSQKNLIDDFNVDFPPIFDGPATPKATAHALPYAPAEATLPPSIHARGRVWHASAVTASAQNTGPADASTPAQIKQRQARSEALGVRQIARRWLARPLPPGRRQLPDGRPEPWRIAVLVRSRNHLAEIVAALKEEDRSGAIPVRAVEIDVLSERQEVLDLTALTRALLHPADRVATLALLRAPWCGLSLAELHVVAGGDDPALKHRALHLPIAERAHLLADDSRLRVERVLAVLAAAAHQRTRLTTEQLVERAWRSLGGDAWLAPPELANARRFLQLLDAIESPGGRIDLAVLEARLQRLYAEPEAVPEGAACVELLTIHNAKGLEWDVVLVPGLERRPAQSASRLLAWSEIDSDDGRAAHVLLAPIRSRGDAAKPLNDWLRGVERAREAAECKRLFYVACTRAREELHLFASPDVRAGGAISPWPTSLLKAAWPAAQSHFPAANAVPPGRDAHAWARAVELANEPDAPSKPQPAVLDLAAASGGAAASHPTIQRVPGSFDPAARFAEARAHRLPYGTAADTTGQRQLDRPEGSLAARSFGNAVHGFLEVFAARIAAGDSAGALLNELPGWRPRIAAVLRADGLAPSAVDAGTRETLAALANTLRDPEGLWLLAPHTGAASELALTSWAGAQATSIRMDRVFHAGAGPCAPLPSDGEPFLWIVDYKSGSHSRGGLEEFLAQQRAAYEPQLEAYARIVAPARSIPETHVRLALYYPAIPRLIWWSLPEPEAEETFRRTEN